MASLAGIVRPLLFALEPETAHRLTLAALQVTPLRPGPADDPRLAVQAFGLEFPNPLGLAAGFDKNGEVVDKLLRLGFGFAEVGTVTPRAQSGNEQPRVFRLIDDFALINRLGFNNQGGLAVHRRLARRRTSGGGIVGINVGANKETLDRAADYETAIGMFADVASFFTVNVSSPNTPGLRDLQRRDALDGLLARVIDAREAVAKRYGRKPVLLKIAPDLTMSELDDVVAVARARRIDGLVVGNTTLSRPKGLTDRRRAAERGGLSGRPLSAPSTQMVAQAFVRIERQFPIVGVGGIDGPDAAYEKIRAGASLLQLYTGLVFEGPTLIGRIKRGLLDNLARDGHERVSAAVGTAAVGTAAKDWENRKIVE